LKKKIEEILETIWTLQEIGKHHRRDIIQDTDERGVGAALRIMEREGLIERDGPEIHLTGSGEKAAEEIIRRHRLAERLLHDLFQLDQEHYEQVACEFEHILDPKVTDSVCTFLGHPPTCPHGKPIPRGECCRTFKREIKPLVRSLIDLDIGASGAIVYITTRHHTRLDRLSALGIMPGNRIKLHQKRPSFIVQIDETNIALEKSIAEEIYVREV
jgi:DtxR family Mn-dependent transcriptional regulator